MKKPKFPIEAALHESIITIEGKKRLLMEGCRRILRYDENEMLLDGGFLIRVVGKKLDLREVGNDNIIVSGSILSVTFGEGDNQ